MSYSKVLSASIIGLVIANSSLAFADTLQSESEFINKTLLGNWKAQTVSKDDQIRNVDISKDRFMDNILGNFKRVTNENTLADKSVDSSLRRYTEQFGKAKKS